MKVVKSRCPADAMTQNGNSAPVIDESKCMKCRVCPMGAPWPDDPARGMGV